MNKNYKSGFVALAGRTNVGKSTLLNALIGQKISIVSDKPQTTRNNIRCIRTTDTSQMVFIDTPGFHKPKTKLGNYMIEMASNSFSEVDVILFLVEEDKKIGKGDMMLIEKLKNVGIPVILVINKVDKINREEVLEKIDMFKEYSFINEIVPISAMKGENIDTLAEMIEKYLPEGPQYFPDDMVTDRAEKFVVSEIIREKIINNLKDEVPHGIAVEILKMREREDKEICDIEATVFCERKTHKGILIGKNGAMLKKIATKARTDIENLLGIQVNLQIWVKVREGWRESAFDLKDLGYTELE